MTLRLRTIFSWHLIGTFLLLGATLAASKITENRKSSALAVPLNTIDHQMAGFAGTDNPPLSEPLVNTLLADSYLLRTYRKPGIQADLFIAFYAQQRAGETMHSPKHCLPGAGWEIWNYATTEIPVKGRFVTVNNYSISRNSDRMLVLYWYQSPGRIIASEYRGKFLLLRDAILHNATAGSIVRIIVPDQPGALSEARALAAELIPQLQRCFGY